MTYEATVVLPGARAAVFAFLYDETRLRSWRDGLLAVSRLDGGAPGGAVRFRERVATPVGARDVTVSVRADPPRTLTFAVLDGPVRPTGALRLRDAAAGATEVAYRIELRRLLPVATPVDRAIFAALRAGVDRSLANLAALGRDPEFAAFGHDPEFAARGANGEP